ncbi:MAG: hypothetical protein ACE5F1_17480 [Planctomycetota bacterium]
MATGFTTCWISHSAVELAGETVSVAMLAATRLQIRCPSGGRQSLWVEVHAGGSRQMIPLRPALSINKGRHCAALVGKTVVPRGRVSLEAVDDAGNRLWHKTVTAREASRVVTIQR